MWTIKADCTVISSFQKVYFSTVPIQLEWSCSF